MIDSYFRDAVYKLKELQDAEIEKTKNTPITLQNLEDTKKKLVAIEETNRNCSELLTALASNAICYKDTAWEKFSSGCFLGAYMYTPPSERGVLFYYSRIAIGSFFTAYTLGIFPAIMQVVDFFRAE